MSYLTIPILSKVRFHVLKILVLSAMEVLLQGKVGGDEVEFPFYFKFCFSSTEKAAILCATDLEKLFWSRNPENSVGKPSKKINTEEQFPDQSRGSSDANLIRALGLLQKQ
ncbi:hypothetical protein CEXT_570181 [Caerostris extrusa]|uniref:Uncharacterized protein n=1 Tax=Caerostris extrusa TaxID=172846 RepID=A0AAV4WJE0_CAEEX|nr:hypothetical protein CEXT_570181 [Caerostris extrusa]